MGIAQECNFPFVQEVYATRTATKKLIPNADVIIELGGEDAKILFVSGSMEVRMMVPVQAVQALLSTKCLLCCIYPPKS